jgi:hypothetical protein
MKRRVKALSALTAAIAAGLFLGCSDGVVDAGDAFYGRGYVHYFYWEGGFWAIVGDDREVYDPVGHLPKEFREEGMRVEFLAEMTDYGSYHMTGPVVVLLGVWPEGTRFPPL